MRILFISSFVHKSHNGAAIFAQLFVQWAMENRHHIDVLSTENHPGFIHVAPSNKRFPVLHQYDISYKYYSAIKALDHASYDIIYFNNVIESYYTALKLDHNNIFAFLHDSQYMNDVYPKQSFKRKFFRYFLRNIERKSIANLAQVHTNSEHMSKQVKLLYDCASHKVSYFYFSSLDLHPKKKDTDDIFTLLFIKTNYISGGLFTLIDACNQLNFPYRLIILGPPKKDHDSIKSKVSTNDVIIYDYKSREEIPNLFSRAHVYVNPAFTEPMGIGNFEAMWMEVPVIGNDLEGIAESAENSNAILLFKKNDATSLASKIGELKSDPKLRQNLIDNGKQFVLSKLNRAVVFQQISQLLHKK